MEVEVKRDGVGRRSFFQSLSKVKDDEGRGERREEGREKRKEKRAEGRQMVRE